MAAEKLGADQPVIESADDLRARLRQLAEANETLLATFEERRGHDTAWQGERELFRAMIDQVPDYLFVKDRDSRFVVANKAVARDLGLEPDELIGKTDLDLHPPALASQFFADEQYVVSTEQPMLDIEEFVIQSSGQQKWLSTSKVPLRNAAGEVIGLVGISRDVTDRLKAEARIQHLAHHDALTDLPNRALLMDRLRQTIARANRDGETVALVFIDLDKFKNVNDSLGHQVGDRFLKELARRMAQCVRAADTVARLSGDEFVIVVGEERSGETESTAAVIERLRDAIAEPVAIDNHLLRMSCSIGVAYYPRDAASPEELLAHADIAMYQAKAQGRAAIAYFTASMNEAAVERRKLQEGLRTALDRNEFFLLYQPQFDLNTGRVRAVEALIRWNHPELGLVMPSRFIPLAEENGTIVEIGDWVIRQACRQHLLWRQTGMRPLVVSINVSARQFRERRFIDRVKAAVAEHDIEPRYLELELTESMLMDDVEGAVGTMRALEQIGVRFAIDDFGTGYSNLSALRSFPVARLKIDRSFINNLGRDQRDRSIARAVIAMAKKLQLRVIAEGVENEEQLAFLRANHCDEVQGFFVSEPLSADAIVAAMRDRRAAEIRRPAPGEL
jgi:diguanylate cyclase (GGDEF)-like protein/PAS domain S-box-containing protein